MAGSIHYNDLYALEVYALASINYYCGIIQIFTASGGHLFWDTTCHSRTSLLLYELLSSECTYHLRSRIHRAPVDEPNGMIMSLKSPLKSMKIELEGSWECMSSEHGACVSGTEVRGSSWLKMLPDTHICWRMGSGIIKLSGLHPHGSFTASPNKTAFYSVQSSAGPIPAGMVMSWKHTYKKKKKKEERYLCS